MRKPPLRLLATLFLACFLLQPLLPVRAVETVDPSRECSLTLTYSKEGQVFPNCDIEIFRVAQQVNGGRYSLTEPFAQYAIRINGITSQKEWQDVANTLQAYIAADRIPATQAGKTDENGVAVFQSLKAGLYLVRGISGETSRGSYRFENTLVLLPRPQDNGSLVYDLEARPKGTITPKPEDPDDPDDPTEPDDPEMQQYQVVKLWKDSGYSSQRPVSVRVELYKNGIRQETVALNAGNDWTYAWEAPAGQDVWTVLERDVDPNYTVSMTSDGYTFTISNSRQAPGGSPPKTGDSFPFRLLILVLCLSGTLLLTAGVWYQRKYR